METAAPIQRLRKGQPRRLWPSLPPVDQARDEYRQSSVYGTRRPVGWEHTVCAVAPGRESPNGNGHTAPAGPLYDDEARSGGPQPLHGTTTS